MKENLGGFALTPCNASCSVKAVVDSPSGSKETSSENKKDDFEPSALDDVSNQQTPWKERETKGARNMDMSNDVQRRRF